MQRNRVVSILACVSVFGIFRSCGSVRCVLRFSDLHRKPLCVVYDRFETGLCTATLLDQLCGKEGMSMSM